jgi:hypothetical protein
LTACNQNNSTINPKKVIDTTNTKSHEKLITDTAAITPSRLTFNNIAEVILDKKSNAWVKFGVNQPSVALHFNLFHQDSLSVSYSPECWLQFPLKTENNKIIVYWNDFIDTKYDFNIVKTVNKIDKKYIGKPFMVLELVNDTTLKATYPIPELRRKINRSNTDRILFPDKFTVSQKFYL